MTTYILILILHVGALGSGNSIATTTVDGFATESECKLAGEQVVYAMRKTVKEVVYVCAAQSEKVSNGQ